MFNPSFGEFFQDITASIKNNQKRLSYGVSVTDFNKDGKFEFVVTGFKFPNLILSHKNGFLENINTSAKIINKFKFPETKDSVKRLDAWVKNLKLITSSALDINERIIRKKRQNFSHLLDFINSE